MPQSQSPIANPIKQPSSKAPVTVSPSSAQPSHADSLTPTLHLKKKILKEKSKYSALVIGGIVGSVLIISTIIAFIVWALKRNKVSPMAKKEARRLELTETLQQLKVDIENFNIINKKTTPSNGSAEENTEAMALSANELVSKLEKGDISKTTSRNSFTSDIDDLFAKQASLIRNIDELAIEYVPLIKHQLLTSLREASFPPIEAEIRKSLTSIICTNNDNLETYFNKLLDAWSLNCSKINSACLNNTLQDDLLDFTDNTMMEVLKCKVQHHASMFIAEELAEQKKTCIDIIKNQIIEADDDFRQELICYVNTIEVALPKKNKLQSISEEKQPILELAIIFPTLNTLLSESQHSIIETCDEEVPFESTYTQIIQTYQQEQAAPAWDSDSSNSSSNNSSNNSEMAMNYNSEEENIILENFNLSNTDASDESDATDSSESDDNEKISDDSKKIEIKCGIFSFKNARQSLFSDSSRSPSPTEPAIIHQNLQNM